MTSGDASYSISFSFFPTTTDPQDAWCTTDQITVDETANVRESTRNIGHSDLVKVDHTDGRKIDSDLMSNEERSASAGRPDCNCVLLAEMPRLFTIVCSNDEERHVIIMMYRHQFRLILQVILRQRRGFWCLGRSVVRTGSQDANKVGYDGFKAGGISPVEKSSAIIVEGSGQKESRLALKRSHLVSRLEQPTKKPDLSMKCGLETAVGVSGITSEDFEEALMRCPDLVNAFGKYLGQRLRHRHRPAWTAPILQGGTACRW